MKLYALTLDGHLVSYLQNMNAMSFEDWLYESQVSIFSICFAHEQHGVLGQ